MAPEGPDTDALALNFYRTHAWSLTPSTFCKLINFVTIRGILKLAGGNSSYTTIVLKVLYSPRGQQETNTRIEFVRVGPNISSHQQDVQM